MNLSLVSKPYTEIRLNLGCGDDIRKGYVNVDLYGDPDIRLDLNSEHWPWENDSVQEVAMYHVLEHLPDTIQVMKELYRICRGGAKIYIRVPHPRHDDFLSDPTHARPITLKLLWLFSQRQCDHWKATKSANTPLAHIHHVDFEVVEGCYNVEESWMNKVKSGEITEAQLQEASVIYCNVIREIDVTLKVCK